MISDGIPEPIDDDLVGPYFLWRLLIDETFQGRGDGAATIDAIADYLEARPGRGHPVHELRRRRRLAAGFLPALRLHGHRPR